MRAALFVVTLALAGAGCVSGDVDATSDDTAVQQESGDAQQVAAAYVGLHEDEALELAAEQGVAARVGTAEDVGQPGETDDYEVGRLTFVVAEGVVAEVIVETETGPQTVAAS